MKEPEKKNVFISHYHGDEESIKKLKDLIGDKYELRNYSVTSEKFNNAKDDDYIKSLLRPLISKAGDFICLIGPHTHDSDWVNWEIEQAMKMGKNIVGVFCNGAADSDIPENLQKFASSIVGWRSDKIIDALNEIPSFENADGTQRISQSHRGVC